MDYKIAEFEKHNDRRGDLVVFLKKKELGKNQKIFGQIYFVTFKKKGTVRGNHYHKQWREWFGIVSGKLEVNLKDVRTGETAKINLAAASDKYIRLEIGPFIVHSFKSLSEYASMINYANREWSNKDTYIDKIMKANND
ncbi:hypothetical protein A3J20_01330 [Candidatus Gottesmanbacteria bacterium RIFCSPLOWO2_02_FULL_42_29]|uniref:Capsular polysaccharide assembling protein CapF C-terminal domain-containing protein n=1 Tax=Candidatus Gottesmanbacteria bacterium RIFCSPLOWO2_01_FULL_42_22 TaxID=1798391 RepID=A0A1F6BD44_9BACT|nr:MAG: hypothetical protein A2781_06055 [Candidatus Gottesmanbacteria bacterium RIFCSPHIGHO2_01_FULL_42_27]OGG22003.1 MAG: hypothetical protein A3E72_00815 [Candidatus Gottesmanbacteria bacterium RIFCSPHIGHO2_12_FULL_43_26]OGG34713.1 MAG: hypothetical protein A2968_02885 [Candidatus Gottesmanbacteria bacterium RIFCSPLOWO2_01_FULL_42_22]OGG39222.1 MAG: hypothetical protein A3J20_01330 [Candidatus Gottesmanbacteria bacterium RIFCSPLOWO2_02_FULL_42_29]